MEKPIRILENEKMRNFNDKVRHGIEHAINFILASDENNKVQISYFDPFLMPIQAYLDAYKKKSVLIKIFAENAFQGELYWFFELKTAIALGSMMRMLPQSSLDEKVASDNFDATDRDSFGEVGNQLCGILDRAFRGLTKKNIHLKMDFEKKVYPDEAIQLSTFLDKEEYVVLLSSITLPKQGSQKLTLLLPRTLYEVLLNLELQLTGITPKIVLLHTWNEDLSEELQKRINTRSSKLTAVKEPDELLTMVDKANIAGVAIDLKSLSFPLTLQESILIKRITANRSMMRVPLFFSYGNAAADGIKALHELGLKAASETSLEAGFIPWCQNILKDPGIKP